MPTYRITRTLLRGQFASHPCFIAFLSVAFAEGKAVLLDTVFDPSNDGGPNDSAWVLWVQNAEVTVPKDCDPDLLSRNGVNGWATEAEARVALAAFIGQANAVNATVAEANKQSLGKSVQADVAGAAQALKTPLGAGLLGATALYAGGILAGAAALYYWLTRKRS